MLGRALVGKNDQTRKKEIAGKSWEGGSADANRAEQ